MASLHPSTDRARRLRDLFVADERPAPERERLVRLLELFASLPPPPDPLALFPDYGRLLESFRVALDRDDADAIESRFLLLYSQLHGYEVPLTEVERQRFRAGNGYLNHVGGLSPILKAWPHVVDSTVSADFGAGNGLQGLLLQVLSPHAKTVQIEISSRLVEAGQALQGWLGIPKERIEWLVGDVGSVSPAEMDFIYIYRPVRPIGKGRAFYERFARELGASRRPVILFSIADCLRDFLPPEIETFYCDGHLTCLRRRAG